MDEIVDMYIDSNINNSSRKKVLHLLTIMNKRCTEESLRIEVSVVFFCEEYVNILVPLSACDIVLSCDTNALLKKDNKKLEETYTVLEKKYEASEKKLVEIREAVSDSNARLFGGRNILIQNVYKILNRTNESN